MYNVGDRVIIRPDLDLDEDYPGSITKMSPGIVSGMLKYAGRHATVRSVCKHSFIDRFTLDIDNEHYFWSDTMLLPDGPYVNILF